MSTVKSTRRVERYRYTVQEHMLPALFNADYSMFPLGDVGDAEIAKLNAFERASIARAKLDNESTGNIHWKRSNRVTTHWAMPEEDAEGYFGVCEVTHERGQVQDILLIAVVHQEYK